MTGHGSFLADKSAGSFHVVFLRSTEPHARITYLDTTSARQIPGVIGVFTAVDLGLAGTMIPPLTSPDPDFEKATTFLLAEQRMPVLATDRVHYVGQPIAVAVAENRYLAEDAVEAIEVTYETLPTVVDAEAALASTAPVLFEHLPDNEAARIGYTFGEPDKAFAAAHHVFEGEYTMSRHGAVPLECRGVQAHFDVVRERVDMWTSTQIPHMVRKAVCGAAGWNLSELVVRVPDVGGGFGTKANVYGEEVVVAILSRITGLSVIWVEDRQEHLASAAQGRDQRHRTRLAVDRDGRIMAWGDRFVVDIGAGSLWVAGIVANTAVHLLGPYRVPAVDISGRAALTNKTIVAQYRGAGRPEASFALERSLDGAARALGISPVEIRRRNLLTADDMPYARPIPYRDGVPIAYDGGNYLACLDAAVDLLGPEEVADLMLEHPDCEIGYGVASYIEATGRGPLETARITLLPGGRFEVTAGSAAAGQGHETVFAQVAADALGVAMSTVRYVVSDTERLADGVGTFASRSAILGGSAVHRAALELVALASARLARIRGSDVSYQNGCFVVGAEKIGWADVEAETRIGGAQENRAALDVTAVFRPETVTWTMGVHATIVAVQRSTGVVSVLRYAVAHEGGTEINPMIVHGQILGGVAQGLGGTLFEEWSYSEAGQPQSTTFAGYHMPLATDVPDVRVAHLHVDTDANPIGVRGAGESGTIAVYAAVSSAVDDALGGRVHVCETPISTGQLWRALNHSEVLV